MTNQTPAQGKGTFALPSPLYDVLKDTTQIYLPAFGVLYFGLGQIWPLYEPDKVVATITLFVAFLGTCLKISTSSYNKSYKSVDGSLKVNADAGGAIPQKLSVDLTSEELADRDKITLSVEPQVTEGTSMDPRNIKRASQN